MKKHRDTVRNMDNKGMPKIKILRNAKPPEYPPMYPFLDIRPGDAFEVEDLSKHNALRSAAWRFGQRLGAKFKVHKRGNKIIVFRQS
jgi:hypothetical protein